MKRTIALCAIISIIAAMAVSMTSCTENTNDENSSATASTVVATSDEATNKDRSIVTENNNTAVTEKTVDDTTASVKNTDSKKSNSSSETSKSDKSETSSSSESSSSKAKSNSNSSSSSNSDNSSDSKSSNSDKNNNSDNSSSNSGSSSSSSSSSQATWHEAVYKTVHHDAVTERVWVVDKAAYTYEEPVYKSEWRTICNTCGADITENLTAHAKMHLLEKDEDCSYRDEFIKIQTGTETVEVPEVGHYENQVIKEGYDEQILVKEAGYY